MCRFFKMLIPKKDRIAIFSYLFKEGVVVAKKDLINKHPDIDVPNLHVIKLMLSLESRGYIQASFCWAHHYYYLTNEGIEYLREYLHLPEEIVPATLKRRPATREGRGGRGYGKGPAGEGGAPAEGGKEVAPTEGSFKPTFDSVSTLNICQDL